MKSVKDSSMGKNEKLPILENDNKSYKLPFEVKSSLYFRRIINRLYSVIVEVVTSVALICVFCWLGNNISQIETILIVILMVLSFANLAYELVQLLFYGCGLGKVKFDNSGIYVKTLTKSLSESWQNITTVDISQMFTLRKNSNFGNSCLSITTLHGKKIRIPEYAFGKLDICILQETVQKNLYTDSSNNSYYN